MNAPPSLGRFRGKGHLSLAVAVASSLVVVFLAAVTFLNAAAVLDRQAHRAAITLAKGKGDQAATRKYALAELRRSPYNVALLSGLGLNADRQGRKAEAARLMAAAGNLTWRDAVAGGWLAQNAILHNDYSSAVTRVDALLRTHPALVNELMPALLAFASAEETRPLLVKQLAAQPDWRAPFLKTLTTRGDLNAALGVLQGLQETVAPPEQAETSPYVWRLVSQKQYDQALLSVMLLLPPERLKEFDRIFNGDFNDVAGIQPFDWAIVAATGASVSMEAAPGRSNERAAHIFYNGNSSAILLTQTVALPAGFYKMTWDAMSLTPSEQRLQWTLTCLTDGSRPGEAGLGGGAAWGKQSVTVTVDEGCSTQTLQLKSVPAGRSTASEVWVDKVAFERIGAL